MKITLRPGQSLTRYTGGATDEGYSHTWETWRHEGDYVECERVTESRDCDGRFDSDDVVTCPIDQLRARPADGLDAPRENAGIVCPNWQRVSAGQRDYAAEAAGY